MLHKTVDNSDIQSQSTKVPSSKAASFVTSSKRQMYRNAQSSTSKKVQLQICNLITLEPEYVSYVVDDKVYFLDSSLSYVVLSQFHYGVFNDRAQPVMIGRNCQPGAELLFADAKKPGLNINLYSIHKFSNPEYPSMLHFNLTKYNPGQLNSAESRDVYLAYGDQFKPVCFVTVENSKKGVLVSQVVGSGNGKEKGKEYEIAYINLIKGNKVRNQKHSSMQKQNSFSISHAQQDQKDSQPGVQQKQFLYPQPETLRKRITLKPGQQIIKMLNSEFGDSILIITNIEIYELEFQPSTMLLKNLDLLPKLAKSLKKQSLDDEIKNACYIMDGLKIIFLTRQGYIGFVDAQNIQYVQSMADILGQANKKEEGKFVRVYSLLGKNAVQTDAGAIYLLKIGDKELSFEKKFEMPVQGTEIVGYRPSFLPRHDELILARVSKQGKLKLQILCKNLLSPGNQFSKLYSSPYQPNPNRSQKQPIKIVTSKANSMSCILKQHSLQFYTFTPSSSHSPSPTPPILPLFTKTIFQKPLSISIDPYSSSLLILYKQFLKFYKIKYNDIVPYYTYNMRNISYAGYTEDGQAVVVVVEDVLYLVNGFTWQTLMALGMYGDVRSVRFWGLVMYVLVRVKAGKGGQAHLVQTYVCYQGKYICVHQLKLQYNQAVLTDPKFLIKASKTQIQVYHKPAQAYEQPPHPTPSNPHPKAQHSPQPPTLQLLHTKKVKLAQTGEYPTCVTLCEQFGMLFVGTNQGRVYQFLWPFVTAGEDGDGEDFWAVRCSSSEIARIVVGGSLEKVYVYCKNMSILQMDIIQYVEGQQMSNIYIINPKTLYPPEPQPGGQPPQLKYQFANRQHLYPQYTPYIHEDIRQVNENIEQLKFILEKTKDDIEENVAKTQERNVQEVEAANKRKERDVGAIKGELRDSERKWTEETKLIREEIEEAQNKYKERVAKEKEEYEEKLLELYKEASRLRGEYSRIEKEQTREKDMYLLQNMEIMKKIQFQGQKQEQSYQRKYDELKAKTDVYYGLQREEMDKKIDEELKIFNEMLRDSVLEELNQEEQRKESLLGAKGYLMKEIVNYRQRRDQFESLIMQTHAQIDQLNSDQGTYIEKRQYLRNELSKKQKIIEEKERELMALIESTANMKKLKQTHEFELNEYEQQFEPILSKMVLVQGKVQKMNSEILKEYLNKVEKDKQIMEGKEKFEKLKQKRERKIKIKLDTYTKAQRLLAQLQFLLENPLDPNLQAHLSIIARGQKFQINEEQAIQRLQNVRLLRRKRFIGKEIEEHEKREQQMFRNQNEINRHYNENTMLVREFNNLKQLNRKLEEMLKQTEIRFMAAKGSGLETPRKKVNSMIEFKKFSQKKLTPFQKHEHQYNDMFKKGLTSQTKLTRSGQSMSLLKSLIRDVETIDSRYEKMEIVRERIKSFVNPEIRIRKTMATQRVLFDRKRPQQMAQQPM